MKLSESLAAAALLVGLLGGSVTAPAEGFPPEAFGRYEVTVTRVRIPVPLDPNGPEGVFTSVDADLYVPVGAGPRPLVELAHAWPGTLAEFPLSGWGNRLASRGFVVIVVDRRAGTFASNLGGTRRAVDILDLDSDVHSEDMLRVLRWAIEQSATPGTPLTGAVDPAKLAIGGHSLGAYMATFAAVRARSEGPNLAALVLLDPADERLGQLTLDSSLAVTPEVEIPTILLASEADTHPVQCDMDDGIDCTLVPLQQYAALSTTKLGIKVVGSDHEDVEDPPTTGNPPVFLQMYQRYAIAWIEYWVAGDCAASVWLGGEASLPDQTEGRIEVLPDGSPPPSCG